jgi:hypothetical protein
LSAAIRPIGPQATATASINDWHRRGSNSHRVRVRVPFH